MSVQFPSTVERCDACGTLNDTFVNPNTCYNCGEPWPERPRLQRRGRP